MRAGWKRKRRMPFNADPYISKTPGFPKEGITFYDISPILEDSAVVRQAMGALADLTRPMQPDIIAGVDALQLVSLENQAGRSLTVDANTGYLQRFVD